MSSDRTDSHIIEYHDDGTWTETSVINHRPATKGEKATAITLLAALVVAPLVPLFAIAGYEKWEERRQARKEAKKLKSV